MFRSLVNPKSNTEFLKNGVSYKVFRRDVSWITYTETEGPVGGRPTRWPRLQI
jgi:hypothetical protein